MRVIFLVMVAVVSVCRGEERPLLLPFDVKLGGVEAEMRNGNGLFAEVPEGVAADALLEVGIDPVPSTLIVNVFPCDADGTVEETQAVAVIFKQDAAAVRMDATIDNKKLEPGTYLANVVANGKTARIVFEVGEEKVKVDFGKVLNYLKRKVGGG